MTIDICNHLAHVQGWLKPQALLTVEYYCDNFLKDASFDTLEIGVHHGKFFIGLERLTPVGNSAFAADLFDMQELNIDKSGKGSLAAFKKNCAEVCLNPDVCVQGPGRPGAGLHA